MQAQDSATPERFQVRECGPGYEWLPPYVVVDTEKEVRAGAGSKEVAEKVCAEMNTEADNA